MKRSFVDKGVCMKIEVSKDHFIKKNRKVVLKRDSKQILLIGFDEGVYALDNRCPHEGYPLSEGHTDEKNCVLTCNWHNWKFDLKSGQCFLGGDNVRTYPVEDNESSYFIDVSDPTPDEIRNLIIDGLKVAFEKRQYGRISREVTRLHFNNLDPLYAVKKAILWSYDRFEFGMTHAYAVLADWLNLYVQAESLDDKMICLTEAIDHIAFDCLRHRRYPYADGGASHSKKLLKEEFELELLNSIENEDASRAESLIITHFDNGGRLVELNEVFSTAALSHYNDFGHSLIYSEKILEVSSFLKDDDIDRALALCFVRSLCFATREDLIPEFKNYSYAVAKASKSKAHGKEKKINQLPKVTVNKALEWGIDYFNEDNVLHIYDMVLKANAYNFLCFDVSYQYATNNSVTNNVGWLDFTHAITFSNAVKKVCENFPHLWAQGIMQMLCFYGRNTKFIDTDTDVSQWSISNEEEFEHEVQKIILDHGMSAPILSSHILKTAIATFEECETASEETKEYLLSSLNRFLNSDIKQKHVRRIVSQGIKLVAHDFKS